MKTITFIAATGAPEKRPRLAKAIRLVQTSDFAVAYWGWKRRSSDRLGATLFHGERRALLSARDGGWRTPVGYFFFAIAAMFNALRTRNDRVFWALGFETAVWLRVLNLFVKVDYIFDDADRFVLTVPLPRLMRRVVTFIERSVSKGSNFHIIPLIERYDYDSGKFFVIENTPDSELVQASHSTKVCIPEADLRVFVSGWIGPRRGSAMIQRAAARLHSANVVFIVAPKTLDREARGLLDSENVINIGYVDHAEALAWCRNCDVSLTFYDPCSPINRLAAPNKWGDSLVCGRPFIVNSEVLTADRFLKAGAAFSVPWDDDERLSSLLMSLINDESLRRSAEAKIAALRQGLVRYEDRLHALLKRMELSLAA